jgi:glyoxylase-like metal-dependent hydrolase (beta-lactamase superfamily II)
VVFEWQDERLPGCVDTLKVANGLALLQKHPELWRDPLFEYAASFVQIRYVFQYRERGSAMQITKETANLLRLTQFGIVNCFLVREAEDFTLVDTGLHGSAGAVLAAAHEFDLPIRRIVLTHAHIDHVGSLDALVRQPPEVELFIGLREARLLAGDLSLDAGETGNKLFGFIRVAARPTQTLEDGDRVHSLQTVFCPGHTPGHVAYLDVRDGSLLAGDAFTTQTGLVAAGVFKWHFPFPALFSWNAKLAAESAEKLRNLEPTRLAVGHGKTIESPLAAMDRAVELAFRQSGKMLD